jgi:predicted O-methyltransferase YrrM
MNTLGQLRLISQFTFSDELNRFPKTKQQDGSLQYSYDNSSFGSGDAEFLYNMIRLFKPKRLLEVGSGNSTLMARNAIDMNKTNDPAYTCAHVCIEPFEAPWLERVGVEVIRLPVEEIDKEVFAQLEKNDVLFIDSSHVIRPQGDVLFLYLEVIPSLRPGVLIHVHDIFTPRDYLEEWILDQVKFWNEQYLLEALLSDNTRIEIVGALNFLKHHYPAEISKACPILKEEIQVREPGSFWLLKK